MTNRQLSENKEVTFKDVVLLLWKEKELIIKTVLIIVLISAAYILLIQKTKYEAESKILLTVPAKTSTIYGEYVFPSTEPKAYLNILDSIYKKDKVTVSMVRDENYVTINAIGDSPEKAKKLADEATQKYIELLRLQYKKNAVNVLLTTLENNITVAKESLAYSKELMSKLIKLQNISRTGNLTDSQKQELVNTIKFDMNTDSVAFSEELRQGKYYLDAKIVILQTRITESVQQIEYYNKYVTELNKENELIAEKYGKDNQAELLNNNADVMRSYVSVISEGIPNKDHLGSSKLVELVVCFLLSCMVGIFIVLFKTYWKNS